MQPRYKVIADWPKSIYKVGTIINAGWRSEDLLYCDTNGPRMRDYPHLFRKLDWWEERQPEDMPEYLKDIADGELFKVREWLTNEMAVIFLNKNKKMNHTGFHQASSIHFLPATEKAEALEREGREELGKYLEMTLNFNYSEETVTIREYLKRLLVELWNEQEGFNGKRPFGNSGWEYELFVPLIKAKAITGVIDENGYIESVDEKNGHQIILRLIDIIFKH